MRTIIEFLEQHNESTDDDIVAEGVMDDMEWSE